MRDIEAARLYLVAGATVGRAKLHELVQELADAGVDIIQLREKDMEAGDVIRAGIAIADACREANVPFIVNDRPDVALALDADGVHVGQNDVPVEVARRVVGDRIVGVSTHTPEQFDAAVDEDVQYVVAGPVLETPTKPGRPAAGIELIRHAARRAPREPPVFAIGGIDQSNLSWVLDAGARRIVVVRAITEAPDPVAAAARLKAMLDGVPG